MQARALTTISIAAALSLGLTGCNPPMPPEVLAALTEQTYTCENGESSLWLPSAIADQSMGWADSMSFACEGMTLVPAANEASTSILVSDLAQPASTCSPYARVPFALDAAVIAFNVDGVGNLTLTPKLAEEILSGAVTDWSDPKVAAVNPGFEFTPGPISVVAPTQENTLKSFSTWMSRLNGGAFNTGLLTPVTSTDPAEVLAIPSGGVALVPFSHAALNFALVAVIQTTDDAAMLANPDAVGIATAGTQLKITKSTNRVAIELNPAAKALAPEGIDEVPTPYQAIYSVDMSLCGDESLATRAAARFLLRQDSQGSLGASFMLPLPERVRVESLAEVSKGLNIVVPSDLPQE